MNMGRGGLFLSMIVAAAILAGCDLQGGEDTVSGSETGDVAEAEDTTPDPVVEGLVAAARACTGLIVGSAPGGWQPTSVNELGCIQWIPANWLILGLSGAASFSPDTQRHVHYFNHLLASNPGVALTLNKCRDMSFDSLKNFYGLTEVVIRMDSRNAVSSYQVSEIVFTGLLGSQEVQGFLRTMYSPCDSSMACPFSTMGFWMPPDTQDEWTCLLSQIDVSYVCP